MAAENLCRKIKVVPNVDSTYENNKNKDEYLRNNPKSRSIRKICGEFLSLVIVLTIPISLHTLQFVFLRSAHMALAKPFWFPPFSIMDDLFIYPYLVVGICSWFAWAENGFRQIPIALVALYLGYIALSLAWDPIVFGLGAIRIGLLVSLARLWFVFGISKMLKNLNRAASVIVLIFCECFAFVLFMLNLRLLLPPSYI
ncbi:hypothetical protein Acr_05g0014340 [Actinidia rufa]|uniref:Uncharacterized protein n=1 Tax=Actinidia rufa TaxID=165716 RepID=A0A7J0EMS1_9ERIC|nr:hypothetical protein Acr_05g0014340 [Actinidia rufa]